MNKKFFHLTLAVIFMLIVGISRIYATTDFSENTIKITAGNTISNDNNGYISLVKFEGEVSDGEWINDLEYDGTDKKGNSRLTFKVDKEFISDDDNYYDISIDYFDAGIGVVLLQSSTDEDNSINYSSTGYGGYVEEYWSWADSYYYANISFNLTNTNKWKTYTFRVTDEFFEDNVDNYIHFYFGRAQNFGDTIRVKNMTLTKRLFKIDSVDKNASNNEPVIGNIYTDDDFGMGFKVYNTSDETQLITVSYQILDSEGNIYCEEDLGEINIESKGNKKFYIVEPEEYGTYTLLVDVTDSQGVIEEEEIRFSKIVADLSNEINEFLGINNFYGYSGWASARQIEDAIVTGTKLGIDNTRTNVNAGFVFEDKNSDYNNELGRYGNIYDAVLDTYEQKILFTVHPYIGSNFEETKEGIIEVYESIAREYGDKIEYYEILNEINLAGDVFGISAEQYAEVMVKVSMAIKKIDSDAKIVAIDSNRIPIYADNEYSKYSLESSWMGKVLKTQVGVDDDGDGSDDRYVTPIEITDVISVHPYTDTYTTPPASYESTKPIFDQLKDLREFIDEYKSQYHIEKEIPIWITETGYQTSLLSGVTEEQQAAYLTRILIWCLANSTSDTANIEKVYIYGLQDTGFSNTHPEANYGIIKGFKTEKLKGYTRDVEMAAKKSYVALNNYSYLLNEAQPVNSNEATSDDDEYNWYEFENANGQIIIVAWNNDEKVESQEITLNVPEGNIKIYDVYGNNIRKFKNSNESIDVAISYKPTYIVVQKHEHVLNKNEEQDATCANDGNIEYWICSLCNKLYSDDEGKIEITIEQTKIEATNEHTYNQKVATDEYKASDATCTKKATYYMSCECGATDENETFESGNLNEHSFTNYVYNNDATYEKDGTETAACDNGCTETNTRPAIGTKKKHSSGSKSSKPSTTTQTTKNDDGSVTKIVTNNNTGVVTKTTHNIDGSIAVVKNAKDGKTITTITDAVGNKVEVTETVDGETSASVSVVKSGETVQIPISTVLDNNIVNVTISEAVNVIIPVEDMKNSTVAVIVYEDGTEKVIRKSVAHENNMFVPMIESAMIKVIDNSKEFTDTDNHWGESAIDFVTSHELFRGTSENVFEPNMFITRAMAVQILYNLESNPIHDYDTSFKDVNENHWYKDAVNWSVSNGIVAGYENGNFGVKDNITREQLVTILHNYAKSKGYGTSIGENTNIFSYKDFEETSEYAISALQWAVGAGIMGGNDGFLNPKGYATRAEVASMMHRFCSYVK